jgi:hypothetical protein
MLTYFLCTLFPLVSFSHSEGKIERKNQVFLRFGPDFKQVFFNRTLDGNSINHENIHKLESEAVGEFFHRLHIGLLTYSNGFNKKNPARLTDRAW